MEQIYLSRKKSKGNSDPSGPSKTDRHFISVNNNGHLSTATGKAQHLIEFFKVCPYVEEDRLVPIVFPSLTCIGSTHRAENHHF